MRQLAPAPSTPPGPSCSPPAATHTRAPPPSTMMLRQAASGLRPQQRAARPCAARRPVALRVVAFQDESGQSARERAEATQRRQLQQQQQQEAEHAGAPRSASNPITRSREALDTLLGRSRHGEQGAQAATGPDAAARAALPPPRAVGAKAPAFQAPLSVPVYSRRREVLVGRVAMAAFYVGCQWEAVTLGLGPVGQLSVTTGLPAVLVQGLLGAFVLHGLWGLLPTTPTWSAQNRNDLLRRPKGPPRVFVNPFQEPAKAFGFTEWGFSKANEVFAGRIAMLGWAGVAAAEPVARGRGALGQIAWWLHIPVGPAYFELCRSLLIVLPIVFAVIAYVRKRPGQLGGGDDIY